MALIAMAHEIPYVATATVAELRDIEAKVERAMTMRGARYLHILVTCPLGWSCQARRHHPRRAPGQGDRPVPRLRGRARRGDRRLEDPPAAAPSRSTCSCRAATATSSSPQRREDVLTHIQAIADRNIKRFGLA